MGAIHVIPCARHLRAYNFVCITPPRSGRFSGESNSARSFCGHVPNGFRCTYCIIPPVCRCVFVIWTPHERTRVHTKYLLTAQLENCVTTVKYMGATRREGRELTRRAAQSGCAQSGPDSDGCPLSDAYNAAASCGGNSRWHVCNVCYLRSERYVRVSVRVCVCHPAEYQRTFR